MPTELASGAEGDACEDKLLAILSLSTSLIESTELCNYTQFLFFPNMSLVKFNAYLLNILPYSFYFEVSFPLALKKIPKDNCGEELRKTENECISLHFRSSLGLSQSYFSSQGSASEQTTFYS